MYLIVDAVQVIRDVLRNPESSPERKRKHFANVAISEVYLEAIPTFFLYILFCLSFFIFNEVITIHYSLLSTTDTNPQNKSSLNVLFGIRDFTDYTDVGRGVFIFSITFLSSLLSAAFGIAR